jgi:hypothetical protein
MRFDAIDNALVRTARHKVYPIICELKKA